MGNSEQAVSGLLAAFVLSTAIAATSAGADALWTSWGQGVENTRHAPTEAKIDPSTAASLSVKWITSLGGDISATPAVDGTSVYVPDFGGKLTKLDRDTGAIFWQIDVAALSGVPGNFARTTPAIYGDLLILGDQGGRVFNGATLYAIDRNTGAPVWTTKLDSHPSAFVTQSATVMGDRVYVGVASFEELHAAVIPGYDCCTFRGSMLALDADTGQILWKTYMAPEGYSGNAVWGSAPAIDRRRGQVFVATGNNYSVPDPVLDCIGAAGTDPDAQRACLAPDNYFDSILALDMRTGAVNWVTTPIPFDVWTVECLFGLPGCPDPAGPDFDFGQAPMLFRITGSKPRDVVGVGQKSGVFHTMDAETGQLIWQTQVSPGGVAGGLQWGSSYDGTRIYTSSANSEYQPWVLPDGSVTTGGIYSALDPATGAVLWQTGNPATVDFGNGVVLGANAGGAVSSANGVVFACSQDPSGMMYAMDGADGSILWSHASGASCNAGASISNGQVFWGTGYGGFGPPNTSSTLLHAFDTD